MLSVDARTFNLSDFVESLRIDAARKIPDARKAKLGQYFTPAPIARLMATMVEVSEPTVHILDPGAGVGSLFAHCVAELCSRKKRPARILVTAYEIDPALCSYLSDTLRTCEAVCQAAGIDFRGDVQQIDFLQSAAEILDGGIFPTAFDTSFNCAVLNPPYYKINTNSPTRRLLRKIGVETSNIYTGFLATAARLLSPDGELVAITPRSFCNGPYFQPFREFFLRHMRLRRLHLFESRSQAFREDAVLQENLIFRATKSTRSPRTVRITSNQGPADEVIAERNVPYQEIVRPDDPQAFIYVPIDELATQIVQAMSGLRSSLEDLDVEVSTGRVVDFRAREYLRDEPGKDTAPLIYPAHFDDGYVTWPKPGVRKPSAIVSSKRTESLLVPNETYVVVKRFTAKEERRRVVAAIYAPDRVPCDAVGFENHLNYFHRNGRGLDQDLAKGLAAYLNSTLIDSYFRQFSGHTQVNATDLRRLRYPAAEQLRRLGGRLPDEPPEQSHLDALIEQELFQTKGKETVSPVRTMQRIDDALQTLKDLGLPKAQQNERSALTLLALLNLKPDTPWEEAEAPLCGITQMMEFFAEHYGKQYAPNTRETVRRPTVHQFLDAALVVANPDDPDRPINSPKTVYQIDPDALEVLRYYGTDQWQPKLRRYLSSVDTLKKRYAQERKMARIPVELAPGKAITLSPGGQNVLVERIIKEFCPLFTPGGKMIYVGDTDEKFAYFDEEALSELGVTFDSHGKMPDLIVHYADRDWLVLVEAVTSHGPMNPKRHGELKKMFEESKAGLVFVTAFLTRRTMAKYLNDIAWETEVWVAEAPSHLIHFNGERFLGPYE